MITPISSEPTCPDLYANTRYNLYLRMDKLMKNHLMFLHDRRVPTSNNEAERQLRNYKRKQKQVVSFRSNQSHDYLCKSMSMLVVMRQNESNLFDRVSRILGLRRASGFDWLQFTPPAFLNQVRTWTVT